MSELLERLMRESAERRKQTREAFFASGDPIPDVDLWPPCPICDGSLNNEDSYWYCYDCDVEWHPSGDRGHLMNETTS